MPKKFVSDIVEREVEAYTILFILHQFFLI